MTLSRIGRISRALVVSMAVVLGMSACGGYTVGFMWVLGTQYNQISGFKIDDYTGNLTTMVDSPYSSGGSNPVSIAVRVGGNFVFVVNKGTGKGDGNVAVFAVGEDGILTFQEAYSTAGNTPVWAASDNNGNYLYVLDSQAPAGATNPADGDITVFQIDPGTGRLQLVQNQSVHVGGVPSGALLNFFEVGPAPTTFRVGGSCLYTMDTGDQTIYPLGIGGSGQLNVQVNSELHTGAQSLSSINVSGSEIYLTDAGKNQILPYTAGANCSLSPQADGAVANLPLTSPPVYTMTDAKGKFLYVVNANGTNSQNAANSISAYVIQTTGALVPISDPQNPYPVGNGPVCMVEDPSNQYVYTSNHNDGSVTGKYINQNTGQLSDLSRGSVFPASGLATCLGVSGTVD